MGGKSRTGVVAPKRRSWQRLLAPLVAAMLVPALPAAASLQGGPLPSPLAAEPGKEPAFDQVAARSAGQGGHRGRRGSSAELYGGSSADRYGGSSADRGGTAGERDHRVHGKPKRTVDPDKQKKNEPKKPQEEEQRDEREDDN